MARNEQLIRQHKIMQILERTRFGKTLDEIRDDLVEELGLSSLHTRSVRRDIEALQAAGIDIGSHEVQRGRVWKLGPRFKGSHRITASATELIALSLSRDLLHPLAGTAFWQGIESFWNKIRDSLPASVLQHYEKYRQTMHVLGMPAKSYERQRGMLSTLNRAILDHRVVAIEYQPAGQPQASKRDIHPYGIAFYQSSIYIVADAAEALETDNPIRHLKLDRFRKATALDQWFKPRAGFDLQRHLRESMGIFGGGKPKTFKIRISSLAAPWVVEDPWHPEQSVTQHGDGSLTLTVRASHELEVIPRVMALGAEAELLSPASSRKNVKEMIARMARKYR